MAHYQSITDYLLANGYEISEECGGWFNAKSLQLPNGFQLPTYHFSFNFIAEMSNKHTVEEFAEIAKEKGWVTETQPAKNIVPRQEPGNVEARQDEEETEGKKKKGKKPWITAEAGVVSLTPNGTEVTTISYQAPKTNPAPKTKKPWTTAILELVDKYQSLEVVFGHPYCESKTQAIGLSVNKNGSLHWHQSLLDVDCFGVLGVKVRGIFVSLEDLEAGNHSL